MSPMAGVATTICLVGFPPEGVGPRELKNICRWMPGYQGAHVSFAGGGLPSTLFVKFDFPQQATEAVERLNGAPFDLDNPHFLIKAEFARREMEVRASPLHTNSSQMVAAQQFQRQAGPPLMGGMLAAGLNNGGIKRVAPGVAPANEPLVTIVVFALKEKGLAPADLQAWFSTRTGFISLQMNDRIDGMFCRFQSVELAEQALQEANAQGVGAEWARRNLDDDRGATAGGALPMATQFAPQLQPQPFLSQPQLLPQQQQPQQQFMASPGGYNGPPSRRGPAEQLVTICVLGLQSKEVAPETMQEWFQQCPGFDRLQLNERIGGLFVKFLSAAEAENALSEANKNGFGAEWARRNLDDDPTARAMHAAPFAAGFAGGKGGGFMGGLGPKRQRQVGGEIETLVIMCLREKSTSVGDLQAWFAARIGYVALQINEKIDGMFVKFSTRDAAEVALGEANAMGLGAEWARRNLDL